MHHITEVVQHELISDAKDTHAHFAKDGITFLIAKCGSFAGVCAAIHLDGELHACAVEINDEAADAVLSTELERSQVTQPEP